MKKIITGTWAVGKQIINVKLSIIIFKEDESHIVFCPALNLTGYGDSDPEALQSFEVVLGEYFNYTTNKKTLETDLEKMGWNLGKSMRKPATPPDMSYLLNHNEDFRNIFNNHAFRKEDTRVAIPVFV
ncbi:MAG: hypothetical protein IH598_13560 [Bacteroidales bacterium]|nr:hypothetical protein [Bacteroidales bacterium]